MKTRRSVAVLMAGVVTAGLALVPSPAHAETVVIDVKMTVVVPFGVEDCDATMTDETSGSVVGSAHLKGSGSLDVTFADVGVPDILNGASAAPFAFDLACTMTDGTEFSDVLSSTEDGARFTSPDAPYSHEIGLGTGPGAHELDFSPIPVDLPAIPKGFTGEIVGYPNPRGACTLTAAKDPDDPYADDNAWSVEKKRFGAGFSFSSLDSELGGTTYRLAIQCDGASAFADVAPKYPFRGLEYVTGTGPYALTLSPKDATVFTFAGEDASGVRLGELKWVAQPVVVKNARLSGASQAKEGNFRTANVGQRLTLSAPRGTVLGLPSNVRRTYVWEAFKGDVPTPRLRITTRSSSLVLTPKLVDMVVFGNIRYEWVGPKGEKYAAWHPTYPGVRVEP